MGYTERFPGLDERSRKQLMCRSKSLIGHYGFTISDTEDIEQELYLHLHQQLPKYDRARGSKATFVDRVLTSGSRDLIRRQTTMKRDYLMCQTSLDQPAYFDGDGDFPLGDSVCDAQYRRDMGETHESVTDKIDLRIDVQRVLAEFGDALWPICLGMAEEKTPTEISRELGICRQTFYDRKARIYEAFEAAGMRVYVGE